jgi:V/A-type H+-transporting ATPase subunit D
MKQFKLIPTKTNLMKLKRDLSFAGEGYELLEQKRQILIVELMGLIDKTEDAQEKVDLELASAYKALQNAVIAMGRYRIYNIIPSINIESNINIKMRRIMGVNIPQVNVEVKDFAPYFSPNETSLWLDETILSFKSVLQELGKLAAMRISLMRLAQEVRKTVRRVNALERIAIPDYEESIKYIEDILEESDRETFATLKLIKARLEKKKG